MRIVTHILLFSFVLFKFTLTSRTRTNFCLKFYKNKLWENFNLLLLVLNYKIGRSSFPMKYSITFFLHKIQINCIHYTIILHCVLCECQSLFAHFHLHLLRPIFRTCRSTGRELPSCKPRIGRASMNVRKVSVSFSPGAPARNPFLHPVHSHPDGKV